MTVQTTGFTTSGRRFTLTPGIGTFNYTVDWGDGSPVVHRTNGLSINHTYSLQGSYDITITGQFPHLDQGNFVTTPDFIVDVKQWGDIEWHSMHRMFKSAINLTGFSASDTPDLDNVTNMRQMFQFAENFNSDLNSWDVSNVTRMDYMFDNATSFNGDISDWETDNVQNFERMFNLATSFDQNIGDWNISSATTMNNMFTGVEIPVRTYNEILKGWAAQAPNIQSNVSFHGGDSNYSVDGQSSRDLLTSSYNWSIFDGGLIVIPFIMTVDIEGTNNWTRRFTLTPGSPGYSYNYTVDWGDGTVQNFTGNSNRTNYYQSNGQYDISITGDFPHMDQSKADNTAERVIDVKQWGEVEWRNLSNMFNGCINLTGFSAEDIPIFWQSSVYMDGTFEGASQFNYDISHWDTSQVWYMTNTFKDATSFDQDLGELDISSVTTMGGMFTGVSLSSEIYSDILNGWAAQAPNIQSNVLFHAGDSQYFAIAESSRELLTSTYNWNIIDLGRDYSDIGDPDTSLDPFIMRIDTRNTESGSTHFRNYKLTPGYSGPTYNYSVDWGDGSPIEIFRNNDSVNHLYIPEGEYDIKIWGDINHILSGDDRSKVIDVKQWGHIKWTNMERMFHLCSNLTGFSATDAPDLSNVTNMSEMFLQSTSFNQDLNNWDTSNVVDMSGVFRNASAFNGNIADWDTSNVTIMTQMFMGANSFNQDIGGWDTGNVTNMVWMFHNAYAFNQNIGGWDISSVTTMTEMFRNVTLSIFIYDNILNGWAAQAPNIQSNVTFGAGGSSHSSNSQSSKDLLTSTYNWTITDNGSTGVPFIMTVRTTEPDQLFILRTGSGTYNYIIDWGDGTIENHTSSTHQEHTYSNPGDHNISITGTFAHIDNTVFRIFLPDLPSYAYMIIDVKQWGDIEWNRMSNMFYRAYNLENFSATDAPDLSNVMSIRSMFREATSFNGDINHWDTSNVTNMGWVFRDAAAFNKDLNNWNTQNVFTIDYMFMGATNFNGNISSWDTSNVTDMSSVFNGAMEFNQDLNDWIVNSVTNFNRMFRNAIRFNGNISSWNIISATDVEEMFEGASMFNRDISGWNTSGLISLRRMFHNASSFNQDLNNWDTSNVVDMSSVFRNATSFDQDLGDWDISSINSTINQSMQGMFLGVTLSVENYDSMLTKWWGMSTTPTNVRFHGGNSKYGAISARQALVHTYGWAITDGGELDKFPPYYYNVQEGEIIYHQSPRPGEGIRNAFAQYWVDLNVQREEDILKERIRNKIDNNSGDSSILESVDIVDDETLNSAIATLATDIFVYPEPGGYGSGSVTVPSGETLELDTNVIHEFRSLTVQNNAKIVQKGFGNRLVILVRENLILQGNARIEWQVESSQNGASGSDGEDGENGRNASSSLGGRGGDGALNRTGGSGGTSWGHNGGNGATASGRNGGGGGGGAVWNGSGGAGGTQTNAGANGPNGSHGTSVDPVYNSSMTKYSDIVSVTINHPLDNATSGGNGRGGSGGNGGDGGGGGFGSGASGGGGGGGRGGTGGSFGTRGESSGCIYIEAYNIIVSSSSRFISAGGDGGNGGDGGKGGKGGKGGEGHKFGGVGGEDGDPGSDGGNGGIGGSGAGGNGGLVLIHTRQHNISYSNIEVSAGDGGNPGSVGIHNILEY